MNKNNISNKTLGLVGLVVVTSLSFALAEGTQGVMTGTQMHAGVREDMGMERGRGMQNSSSSMMMRGQRPDMRNGTSSMMRGGDMQMRNGVAGSVTAINGSTITVEGKTSTTTTTYTVDASNAVFMKNRNTSSVTDIAIGDHLIINGTTTGTSIVAGHITNTGTSTMGYMSRGDHGRADITATGNTHGFGFLGKIKNFFSGFFR